MDINTSQSVNQRWPSLLWLRWLQISYWVMVVVTWLVSVAAMSELTMNWLTIPDWWLVVGQSIGWRWAVGCLIILGYWQYRLKGRRPAATNNNLPFLTYLDRATRIMFWRTLVNYYQRRAGKFTGAHLLREMANQAGVRLALVRLNISQTELQQIARVDGGEMVEPALTSAFTWAANERSQVDWSHLLKGLISASASWAKLLENKQVKLAEALAVVDWTRKYLGYREPILRFGLLHDLLTPQRNLNRTWTAKATPILDRFSQNFTELAKIGLLTSAKVRQAEVEEAVRILSKSQQNSLILVGEPGVGKTSIVGEIALRMLKGDIPGLVDHKLIALDIGGMIGSAGDKFQAVFSQAMQEAALSGNTILFIGNLDQLGKAKSGEGFDLSAILLDALQNNQLQIIGTSDPLNYKKYIENNANLMMWFSRVGVGELDFDNAVLVLEDLSHRIESRQGVLITLEAIKTAARLSQQYIHTGKLPDKAEDVLDEAAVYAARHNISVVTAAEVAVVMSSKTNVPIGEINKEEKAKLIDLAAKIHERLIGQDEAVTAVAEALKRARLGVAASGKRPIGSFLFLGPTGVGKTELAKSLAWAYFGDESKIIRLDMGEYQTRESAHNLLGAPVAAGDIALAGGSFTEKIKQIPFTVVLLDEIEKAHAEILNVFLRVLDEGKMTDNLGNEVDFTHTIIIATSNAEARFIEESVRQNLPYIDLQKSLTQRITQQAFRPEFINRFDGVIVFKPLTMTEIEQIADIKIRQLSERLKTDKGIELQVSPAALKALAAKGYDPAFGARPLERVIREVVETKVANSLLSNSEVKRVIIDEADVLG